MHIYTYINSGTYVQMHIQICGHIHIYVQINTFIQRDPKF